MASTTAATVTTAAASAVTTTTAATVTTAAASAVATTTAATVATATATATTIFGVGTGIMGNRIGEQNHGGRQHASNRYRQQCLGE
ncbi:hypothetical protein IIE18_20445 [Pseudomonas sp. V1]|nr:hypothetical protein [Pseudomonas arcuscaelestis]